MSGTFPSIAAIVLLFALIGCTGSYEPTDPEDLKKSFESEFGFPPPEGVSDIKSKTQQIGDTWSKWMRFRGGDQVFSAMIQGGFQAFDLDTASGSVRVWSQDYSSRSPNAPSWWTPAKSFDGTFYKSDFRADFAASYHVIWMDDAGGYIYSLSGAWD